MNARCLGRRPNIADDEFSVTTQIIRVEADRWSIEEPQRGATLRPPCAAECRMKLPAKRDE
jgi:hypothetical protein